MAKRENVSAIPRKGKPSGNDHGNAGLNEPFLGTDPETENQILAEYIDDETGEPATDIEVKRRNRHLHKGEERARFKDREEA
jgi:hypothetical protein